MILSVEIAKKVLGKKLKKREEGGYYFGIKTLETNLEIWDCFWKIVHAAGKAAQVEWELTQAGRPQATGGTYFDTRKTPPQAGFHLRITKVQKLRGDWNEYWEGKGFPATPQGLATALEAAEEASSQESVLEILLEVSWRGYLPEVYEMGYCEPIIKKDLRDLR